ncbi:unnamed protein product [Vitrella brassicaformis CCMP3155]|uniref:Uncharacterized protein n=1 Tax=Vitrella brassicaformis (strain CCMP3155) TaxID=1169540 RepID=A0A0G4FN30_VITBC|nr:unnamed protein product [Vitrella brassicaformis CCMP3155]|eukprot:CEM15590.1 unnamed protein product [Vitrella brassicaformis CCMP3155]
MLASHEANFIELQSRVDRVANHTSNHIGMPSFRPAAHRKQSNHPPLPRHHTIGKSPLPTRSRHDLPEQHTNKNVFSAILKGPLDRVFEVDDSARQMKEVREPSSSEDTKKPERLLYV